jgi:two-component system OmpR family response regulator
MTKKRILVVDDETSITRLVKLNLERTGCYDVREVNAGASTLQAAREFQPDLILMDVMMPDLSGGEAAAQLRQDPACKRIPVIFLTAAVKREELAGSGGKIGGRQYVAKPISTEEILAVIERVFNPPKAPGR